MEAAVFDGAFVAGQFRIILVEDNPFVEHVSVDHVELYLVGDQGLVDKFFQQLNFGGGMVTHPKLAHLTGFVQLVESLRHLFRFDQWIRAVEQ